MLVIESVWDWVALGGLVLGFAYYFGGLEEGRVRESWNASITFKKSVNEKEIKDFNEQELKKLKWQKGIAIWVIIFASFWLFSGL